MKVAYFAESSADAAALTILTEAILSRKTELIGHAGLRSRGWPSVRTVLPAVLKELHYHTDAEGFVLVVDSNGSPPHSAGHEAPNAAEPKCRLCQLRRISEDVQRQVRLRVNQRPLKIALGLAVPTIEAWLLCGVDSHVTEAAWANGLKDERGRMPYTKKSLKQQLYGTSHPSLAIETEAMKEAAARISNDLAAIEKLFPDGFGALLRSLRTW
ncbi:MAG: hypothetical protein L0Z50_10230 [Verrucomicrobiales bacterium]|nr:hypothetical protein [Verrucomicrobiales bacterium]